MTFTTDVENIRRLQRHKHGVLEALTPLLHCVDDTLVYAFPVLRNALQLLHSPDLLPVDSLLELVSFQTADILNICRASKCRTTFAVNAEFCRHMSCITIDLVLCLFAR